MRFIILAIFCSLAAAGATEYPEALARHVRAGGVDYAGWKASPDDMAALVRYTDEVATKDVSGLSRDARMAFLINAYNAWMLRQVLEKYPIASVKDIAPAFGVFSKNRITVSGEKMSLNRLEKELLIKKFREPRVHFAVNCASRSCPALRATLWTPENLNAQFDEAARAFLTKNALGFDEKTGAVSQIFDWYAADFGGADGVRAYIEKYRKAPAKLTFLNYDWSLNSAK